MKRRTLLVTVSVLALVAAGPGLYLAPLAADPVGAKDCGSVLGSSPARADPPRDPGLTWAQLGGTLNDASCLSRTQVAGVVAVRREADVAAALTYARANRLTVTAAGVRHSMGGQAFAPGGLVLDMRPLNGIILNADRGNRHRRRRGDLARHPECDPSALRGQGDAVDRHLHRRRLDRGQRSRHGPSRRRGDGLDPLAAGDALRRADRGDVAHRRARALSAMSSAATACSGSCSPRARDRSQRYLRLRAPDHPRRPIPRDLRSDRCRPRDRAHLRAPLDRAGLAARRGFGLFLPAGRRSRHRPAAARRSRFGQDAAAIGQSRQARQLLALASNGGPRRISSTASRPAPSPARRRWATARPVSSPATIRCNDSVAYLRNNLPAETDILHEYSCPARGSCHSSRGSGGSFRPRTSIWSTPRSARSAPRTMH